MPKNQSPRHIDIKMQSARPQYVLHITTIGQTLWFLQGYATTLRCFGLEMRIACQSDSNQKQFIKEEKIDGFACPMERRITPVQDLKCLAQLIYYMNSLGPLIVHAHTPKAGLLGMIAAFFARVPIRIYHIHGLPIETSTGLRKYLLWLSDRTATLLSTEVLAVSDSVVECAKKYKIVSKQKITVLGSGSINGVDGISKFNPSTLPQNTEFSKEALHIPKNGIIFGFIGRLVRDKGIIDLVEAWKNLKKYQKNAYLLIAGETEAHDPLPAEVIEFIRDETTIKTLGFVKNTEFLYAILDVLVLPTYREGLPTILLEAAAMETPVIASRATGCVDVVIPNSTGLLYQKGSIPELVEKMKFYIENPVVRSEHGSIARKMVLKNFNRDNVQKLMYQKYKSLIDALN